MDNQKWDISRLSTADKSALRQDAGVAIGEAKMKSVAAFYRVRIAKCKPWQEEFWFPALCMRCLWRESDYPQVKPFPEMLRLTYQDEDATDSARKRCVDFLDYSWGADGFLLGKIFRLVKKLKAENPSIMPDFEALADDFSNWNHPKRYVQRRWLSIICSDRKNGQDVESDKEEPNRVD